MACMALKDQSSANASICNDVLCHKRAMCNTSISRINVSVDVTTWGKINARSNLTSEKRSCRLGFVS